MDWWHLLWIVPATVFVTMVGVYVVVVSAFARMWWR